MPNNVAIPFFKPGQDLTGTVTGANVSGKRFVAFVPGGRPGLPNISPATAAGVTAGVAGHDQAVGGRVHILGEGVVPVVAGADLVANTRVEVGANGTAVPLAAGIAVGTVIANAATGADAPIRLSL